MKWIFKYIRPRRFFLTILFVSGWLNLGTIGLAVDNSFLPPDKNLKETSGSGEERFKMREILIKFKSDVSSQTADGLMMKNQAVRLRTLRGSRTQLWQVPEGKEVELARSLSQQPDVDYAEPNYIYHAFAVPNDQYFDRQWGHSIVGSSNAWDVTTGNDSIVIAIIDTGIDATHPDLSDKIVAGHDFVNEDAIPDDENGHGTHVAGIAAASTNNTTGIAGMDWQAKIMPLKVLDFYANGYNSDITEAITWAHQHGAHVINLSLGGTNFSEAMQDAVDDAHGAGCLVVAAMGNNRGDNPTNYPAAYDHTFAVAATDRYDTYANYSQYGDHCDIAAPGGEMTYYHDSDGIYSTMPTYWTYMTGVYSYYEDYDRLQGTSQAAPFVSGLAALIWSLKPAWSPDQVQEAIELTAQDLGPTGWDPDYGHGRIDAYAALINLDDDCDSDYEGEDGDVDGADLAFLAQNFGTTLFESDLIAFTDVFGSTDCP